MYNMLGSPSILLLRLFLLLGLRLGQLEGFWRAFSASPNRLPGSRSAFEVPEGLGQLQRFDNNTLSLLIVSELSITGKRKVLSQWVAIEAIVGHNATQIRVTNEEDTKHVVDFTLVPVGTIVERCDRRDGLCLVGVGLNSYPGVVTDTEQVVDYLEPLVATRKVDSCDIRDRGKLGGSVVPG